MMIKTKLFMVTLISTMCLYNPANASETPSIPDPTIHQTSLEIPAVFHPRLDNVFIILNTTSNEVEFSITNIIQLTAHTVQRVFSLMNWRLKTSNQEIEATPYSRKEHFGGWVRNPKDKSCYNTRAKVLIRESHIPVVFKENNCTVATGKWHDPYAGEVVTDAQEMQIDHMVPLKDAYISGAYNWSFKARCLYGNYLGNKEHLVAAYGEENNQKGDATPEEYMPPKNDFKCTYLKNWLFVKALWGLSMSQSESLAVQTEIKANNCNTDEMVVTQQQLDEQGEFFKNNIELCRNAISNEP